jgi:hypothetical protein
MFESFGGNSGGGDDVAGKNMMMPNNTRLERGARIVRSPPLVGLSNLEVYIVRFSS